MSRRKHKHEEHQNHEAWAIPYGDLITLLLAFFVVMYAMSSVNEGKYRVLSDSLVAAFRGSPRTMEPIQVGEKQVGSGADIQVSIVQQAILQGQPRSMMEPVSMGGAAHSGNHRSGEQKSGELEAEHRASEETTRQLATVAEEVEKAMADLVDRDLVVVRRHEFWVEVEIRTDILFPSGSATLSPAAVQALQQLADTLKPFPNPMRVEGHTDNRPISTKIFPSNWELSAARAGSVVQLFTQRGIDPARLAVIGLGQYRPAQDNATEAGRNANRRVLIVVLSGEGNPEGAYSSERGKSTLPTSPQSAPDAHGEIAAAPKTAPLGVAITP